MGTAKEIIALALAKKGSSEMKQQITALTAKDTLLETRIDEIIAPTGEAPNPAEVTDARIGYDATVYPSLGGAVRGQVGKVSRVVDDISASNKNLWANDSEITFVTSKTVALDTPLAAGPYVMSAVVSSDDTTYNYCRVVFGSVTVDLTKSDERTARYFNLSSPVSSVTFYASRNSASSSGKTATFSDIMIEAGHNATAYVPHSMTAVDSTARELITGLVKYVSPSGSDDNSGDAPDDAYATIGKAIAGSAGTVFVAKGTYTEPTISENQSYRYKSIKIIADNATFVPAGTGLQFRLAHVDISGLTVDVTEATSETSYGLLLLNCTGSLTNCKAIGAKGAGGFRLDGSRITLRNCVAENCAVDGFNGHTINTGYETECTLIDCVAHDCGDDGASIHENGKMYVVGGEYYNNVQTGLAPHDLCTFEAFNVHCHNNGIGIDAVKDSLPSGTTPAVGRVIGCILNDNTTYGLHAKNYTVNTLGNGYANNGSGATKADTGATINAYTVS